MQATKIRTATITLLPATDFGQLPAAVLRHQGVEKETAHEAVDQVIDESAIDMQEQANNTALKKVRSLAKLKPAVRQRHLYAVLARRGYSMDDIKKAIAVALEPLR